MTGLHVFVGNKPVLPLSIATETLGILAVKRAGKSNAAVVIAEDMHKAGIPWVAVDPKGDWWGVRSDADGKGPGLPVVVFGGEHGDVPLEPTAGRFVAGLIVEQRLTCVLDVSEMSKADQRRFLADFAHWLYKLNREPLHVFCEEADEYIPQMVRGEDTKVVAAFETLVKRGGFHGLGVTLISQRSASLNKDVLTQIGTLIVLRTTSPQDRKAIEGWIKYHDQAQAMLAELSGLANGEAWLFSPEWLHTLQRVRFGRRWTFDSGATPTLGKTARTPVTLAEIDLAAIKEQMAETIEAAKANDPVELRKRIKDLERQLANHQPERVEVEVPVPTVPAALAANVADLEEAAARLHDRAKTLRAEVEQHAVNVAIAGDIKAAADKLRANNKPPFIGRVPPVVEVSYVSRARDSLPRKPRSQVGPDRESDIKLGKGEKTVLGVLAQWPQGRTYNELAFLAGYSAKASTLGVILARLRKAGYVEPSGNPILLTADGLAAAGGAQPLPTGQELLDHWLHHPRMGEGERKVLLALIDQYPNDISHDELCEITGYSPTASTMGVILSRLRKLGLVDRGARRVAGEFIESIS